jgi:hypothetical protein
MPRAMSDDNNVTDLDSRRKREDPPPFSKMAKNMDLLCDALGRHIAEVASKAAIAAKTECMDEIEKLRRRVQWLEANAARAEVEPLGDRDK